MIKTINSFYNLSEIITNIGTANYIVKLKAGTYTVSSNLTIPSNVTIDMSEGAIFSVNSGVILTINGEIIAGFYQIFDLSSGGSVAGTPRIEEAYPQWFGALANDSHDDTTAINSALSFHRNVFCPKGTYKITDSITVSSGKHLYGIGNHSKIKQYTAGKPIIITGGEKVHIHDLFLLFSSMQSNKYSKGIHIQLLYESVIERLNIQYAYDGIHCEHYSSSDDTDESSNYMYSCSLRDIRVAEYYRYAGIFSTAGPQGNTGSVFSNLYANNWNTSLGGGAKRTATSGWYFRNCSEGEATQLNVEHTINNNCIIVSSCEGFNIKSFHIEGCDNANNYNGFIDIISSNCDINGGAFVFNDVTAANIYSLFRISNQYTKVTISNVKERENTITGGGIAAYVYSGQYHAQCYTYIRFADFSTFANNLFPSPTTNADIPMLIQFNNTKYYESVNGRKVFYLNSIPTTGTFAIGDTVMNTSSSIAESGEDGFKYVVSGWKRITAGSDHVLGTDWVEIRNYTGNESTASSHNAGNVSNMFNTPLGGGLN